MKKLRSIMFVGMGFDVGKIPEIFGQNMELA
jgi:hypothetical protein